MRGSLKQRFKGSWTIRLDLGYEPDPATGLLKRKQRTVTVRGTRRQAEDRLTDLLGSVKDGTFVEPSKLTLGTWLREWVDASVKPRCRLTTYVRYTGIIEHSICQAPLANVPLQKVRPSQLEQYYAEAPVSASTLRLHHAILHRALQKAVRDRLIPVNPAADLSGKPRHAHNREDARAHAWTASEARAFLATARAAGPQAAASARAASGIHRAVSMSILLFPRPIGDE